MTPAIPPATAAGPNIAVSTASRSVVLGVAQGSCAGGAGAATGVRVVNHAVCDAFTRISPNHGAGPAGATSIDCIIELTIGHGSGGRLVVESRYACTVSTTTA